jgi:hypothetical protein
MRAAVAGAHPRVVLDPDHQLTGRPKQQLGRFKQFGRMVASIPVRVASGWSAADKRAYVIADNKLALLSSWDPGLLKAEMEAQIAQAVEVTRAEVAALELPFEFLPAGLLWVSYRPPASSYLGIGSTSRVSGSGWLTAIWSNPSRVR